MDKLSIHTVTLNRSSTCLLLALPADRQQALESALKMHIELSDGDWDEINSWFRGQIELEYFDTRQEDLC
ncbi:hypothetical protein [uncultured Lacticaseibacillus sp.]|uniref:hypothetical protein n=1 Tax=uncultured Lacticaseibacillus sp. TaxID=2775882 RepID=UPI0025931506|nr:hypothetical protein [uncultured Lacticaseibacillus sp.]